VSDETATSRAQHAQAHFIAMAAAFALGVFNDNFFKQAALLIAIAIHRSEMQGWATAIFSLPFLVFAAQAGWLADRFPKRNIVISAKVLELAAMICGAIGICMPQTSIPLILVMLGVMGLQATILSPALNASIAELYPAKGILKANAVLRTVVTGNVLAGVALAGFALARPGAAFYGIPRGRLLVAVTVVAVAVVGVLASLGVPRRPAAAPGVKFPWSGPLDTIRELHALRKDFLLRLTIITDVFIWFSGSVLVLVINYLGMHQYGALFGERREYATSGLVVAQLVGFAFGGGISSKLAAGERWHRVLVPGALIMSGLMAMMHWVPDLRPATQPAALFVLIGLIGVGGGIIMVPCESFIQMRPALEKKGAVIAAANFAAFSGILVSGPVANLLNAHLNPTDSFAVLGLLAWGVGVGVLVALRRGLKADPASHSTAV
jgi:acyl-[acyl-carrier-protein]-phospholipid O-acyltransferase / long-chain-fatty-acid--[acyl-carrier-protein] ligase